MYLHDLFRTKPGVKLTQARSVRLRKELDNRLVANLAYNTPDLYSGRGASGEDTANEYNGQVGKLLPHP